MRSFLQGSFLLLFFCLSSFLNAQTGDFKSVNTHFKFPGGISSSDYLPSTIIIKLKQEHLALATAQGINSPTFNQLYSSVSGSNLHKKFPHAQAPEKKHNDIGQAYADLSLIYEFSFSASISLEKVIDKFAALGLFEYAEPHYLPRLFYTPSDASIAVQYAVTRIQAEDAWGVNTTTARGDTNVVIGITDTGVEPTHSDLINNIKHNYNDPLGGGDDDGDGYIDNYSGWDLGENDNDPTFVNFHGVHVSGIAAASTDNGIGMAGIGFRCKFLPVKIDDASGTLIGAYEGIVYAADHGCAVINCSWGGPAGGQLGQDVVTYATINKNALVVAAAGNDGLNTSFYPASYDYALSVANTDNSDVVAGSSNYGVDIDVCAPGESIYSTVPVNNYFSASGTSMSAPCAAGAAAIIKSFYPGYNAMQVGEQLKVTCDNIYGVNTITYLNRLGHGRINLFKALTVSSPSIVTNTMSFTDNNDDSFVPNDTVRIRGFYTNYLAAASNVIATVTSGSPYVSILDGTTTLGAMGTLSVVNNNADPFSFRVLGTAPLNSTITFKITFTDASTSYSHFEFFTVTVNVDYVNIAINDVATSITSNGKIGYREDGMTGGLGFTYMGSGTLLYEAGLMIGTGPTVVSDVVRGMGTSSDADFQSVVRATHIIPSVDSEFDVEGKFNDNSSSTILPVNVHHKAYAWTTAGNRKYVIVEYVIANPSASALNNLHAGIFADWDIDATTFSSNKASFDAANKMGYAYYSGAAGTYAGIRLLTNAAPVVHYAIDNVSGGAGGVDMYTGYSTDKKFTTLSSNRADAGVPGTGNDVAHVVSTGPLSLNSGDSVRIAFALIAGDDLADLQASGANAQIMYDNMFAATSLPGYAEEQGGLEVYPNPAGDFVTVSLPGDAENNIIRIFNILGEELEPGRVQQQGNVLSLNTSGLKNGIYFLSHVSGSKKYTRKLIVSR
jgi:hypothetical protein